MYESPIKIIKPIDFITQQITHQINEAVDNQIYEAVLKVGIEVDKDELIKALRYDRGQYEQGFLAGRLSAQSEGEWVSVEERLPKGDNRVLVYLKDNPMSYTRIDTDRLVSKEWVRWGNTVTHWMPLPEPPEMKGGEG